MQTLSFQFLKLHLKKIFKFFKIFKIQPEDTDYIIMCIVRK